MKTSIVKLIITLITIVTVSNLTAQSQLGQIEKQGDIGISADLGLDIEELFSSFLGVSADVTLAFSKSISYSPKENFAVKASVGILDLDSKLGHNVSLAIGTYNSKVKKNGTNIYFDNYIGYTFSKRTNDYLASLSTSEIWNQTSMHMKKGVGRKNTERQKYIKLSLGLDVSYFYHTLKTHSEVYADPTVTNKFDARVQFRKEMGGKNFAYFMSISNPVWYFAPNFTLGLSKNINIIRE